EKFLDDNAASRRPESLSQKDIIDGAIGLWKTRTQEHSFTQGQTIDLHRATAMKGCGKFFCRLRIAEDARARSRNPVPLHKLLRKGFGRFELSGLLARPPNEQTVFLEEVN